MPSTPAANPPPPNSKFEPGRRAVARCDILGAPPYSETEGALTRRYLTPAHDAALRRLSEWMREAGMTVRLDAAANLVGRYEGSHAGASALVIGSHIDSVRNAGRFDGPLGVMLGIDCVEAFSSDGRRLPFAIEVIAFGDEEGSRFPVSMTCSRTMAGRIDPSWLEMSDAQGVTLARARAAFRPGGLAALATAARRPDDLLGYLEAHIEQGPVLESQDLPIGIVTEIAAQNRLRIVIGGTAGHAGTTPMGLRRDPVPAAAEAILLVEKICGEGGSVVGTVGRILTRPGSDNVIAAEAEFSLDIRAPTRAARDGALERVLGGIRTIVGHRGLTLESQVLQDLPDSPSDPELLARLESAVRQAGVRPFRLASGAGHDAMIMAGLCPTAMLFVRCKGGVSHNPAESVDPEDAAVAAHAMLAFIEALAAERETPQKLTA